MTTTLRTRVMTREEFFPWGEAQDIRYEFDGFEPVAMTGGTLRHNQMAQNLYFALRSRLTGHRCRPMGPDAGVATVGDSVRYPDALITCTGYDDRERLVPGVVVAFEVLSPTFGRVDRIVKPAEYGAVPSILRYVNVIVERASVGATVLERSRGGDPWMVRTLTGAIRGH